MVLRKTQKSHMQTDGMKTATNDTNVSGYKE